MRKGRGHKGTVSYVRGGGSGEICSKESGEHDEGDAIMRREFNNCEEKG